GGVVKLADLVVHAGIEKDALGGRRLPGVDVRRDADVPITLDGSLAGHSHVLRTCSARKPCSLQPYDGLPRASSSHRRGLRPLPAARRQGAPSWLSRPPSPPLPGSSGVRAPR